MIDLARLVNRVSQAYSERVEPLVFALRRQQRLRAFDLQSLEQAPRATFDLGADCADGTRCTRLTRLYQRYYQRFVDFTDSGERVSPARGVLAVLDLARYSDPAAYPQALRRQSSNALQASRKAIKAGYRVARFSERNHTPDICDIRRSKRWRAFGPVLDALTLTVDDLGGAPDRWHEVTPGGCCRHWEQSYGVFMDCAGHQQGRLVLDRKLVAYARLHRIGNVVRYAQFMGHAEHMRAGVMMLLHGEIMGRLCDTADPLARGARYLTYGAIEQGNQGLLFWKRKALFRPFVITNGSE